MNEIKEVLEQQERSLSAKRIETVSWGLFFIWLGVAFMTGMHYGTALVGIGVITLGAQAVRRYRHLKTEIFWLTVGALFLAGGIWQLFDPAFALMPVIFVLVGVVVILSVWNIRRMSSPH